MKKALIVLSFLAIELFSFSAEMVSVITPEWEDQTNKDGSGLYFDILREVFRMEGMDMKHTIASWKKSQIFVKEGRNDMMVGEYFSEDSEYIIPKYPVLFEVTVAVSKKGKYGEVNDNLLETKKLVWPLGYEYDSEFDFNVNFSEVQDTEIGLKNIIANRADFHLDDLMDVNYYLEENPAIKSKVAVDTLFENDLYVIFAPTERGQKLADIFDANMEKLIANGKIEEIYEEYEIEYRGLKPRE